MKKSSLGWLSNLLCYGAILFVFNYGGLPVLNLSRNCLIKGDIKDSRIQTVCKTESYLEDIAQGMEKSKQPLLYLLKSAHALSSKHLTYEKPTRFETDMNSALYKGKAACSYFSAFTYSNFLFLTQKLGKEEFKDKVRFRGGYVENLKYPEAGGGHAWLEVYINNEWRKYETIRDHFHRWEKIDFSNLDKLIPDNSVLIKSPHKIYHSPSFLMSEGDKLVAYTNLLYSWESGFDVFRLLIDNHLKKYEPLMK